MSDFNPEESNLCKHARREMELASIPAEDIDNLLSIVESFARTRPSGGQAAWYILILQKLLRFENLTALTDDPEEWQNVSDKETGTWQSRRNPAAFSKDGGVTYYLLDKVAQRGASGMHQSVHKGVRKLNR